MVKNNFEFTYTNYTTFKRNNNKIHYIDCPEKTSHKVFLKNT